MAFNDDEPEYDRERPARTDEPPRAWRVEEGDELTEDDLRPELFAGDDNRTVKEGEPMGGHAFGKGNNTSAANDKNNPSQYAGNTNPYFDRTEPMEEHPENSNFKLAAQQGSPDYGSAQANGFKNAASPKPEKPERGNGENDRPRTDDGSYRQEQGSQEKQDQDDNDGSDSPGPNELPGQQKVGEDVDDDREHIET